MRQVVRSLGWAINIFWIILLLFTATVVYSAFQIRPNLGEPSVYGSEGTFTASLPLTLDNGGFYEISMLNVTTLARDNRGSLVTKSTTLLPLISGGASATLKHNISVAMDQAASSDLSHLLFADNDFEIETRLALVYAKAFPFEISFNMSIPWGAPFANLNLGEITVAPVNLTHLRASVPLYFENHSLSEMNGTIGLEIVDHTNRVVGTSSTRFDVQSSSSFETNVEIFVSGDLADIREARLDFQTPHFSYGPLVMPLV